MVVLAAFSGPLLETWVAGEPLTMSMYVRLLMTVIAGLRLVEVAKMEKVSAGLIIACGAFGLGISAAAIAQTPKIQPGMWEYKSKTTSTQMPGMPPGTAKMMEGRTMTIRHCITAAQAAEGPMAAMKKNPSCSMNYSMQPSGSFTSSMVCKTPQGTSTVTSSGTATPISFSGTSKMTVAGPQSMTIVSSSTGKRIGVCMK